MPNGFVPKRSRVVKAVRVVACLVLLSAFTLTARVYFYAEGAVMSQGIWETNGHRLWRRDKDGVLLTDRNGEVVRQSDKER